MGFLIVGVILLIVGLILFFVQKNEKAKAYSLKTARGVTAAELVKMAKEVAQEIGGGSWRDYVKLAGTVECDRPLTSPLTQTPCAHYTMTVRREYEEVVTREDSDGKSYTETQRGSETVSSNQQSVPFLLQDATGAIAVEPADADLETVEVLEEFRPEQPGNFISYGGFSLALSPQVGKRRTLGYHYSESILPLQRRVTVVGTVADQGDRLVLQKAHEPGKKFMISLRSEEDLTKSADRNASFSHKAMIVCIAVGVLLVVIGLIMAA